MARTERDVMRAKRHQILQQVATEFGVEPDADGLYTLSREMDGAWLKALDARHVYQHYCSPYCLSHERKRVDRRRYRARAKTALRHGRWEEARAMRPRRH